MMTKLSQERLAQAIRSATVTETVIDWTLQYTSERSAFGQKIADFQNTQFKLADLKTKAAVARVFTDKCISLFMEGLHVGISNRPCLCRCADSQDRRRFDRDH